MIEFIRTSPTPTCSECLVRDWRVFIGRPTRRNASEFSISARFRASHSLPRPGRIFFSQVGVREAYPARKTPNWKGQLKKGGRGEGMGRSTFCCRLRMFDQGVTQKIDLTPPNWRGGHWLFIPEIDPPVLIPIFTQTRLRSQKAYGRRDSCPYWIASHEPPAWGP